MDYIFTWACKPKQRKRTTVKDVEDAYRRIYPELKHVGVYQIMDTILRRGKPAELTTADLWGYMIYAVLDCGYNVDNYYNMLNMRRYRKNAKNES